MAILFITLFAIALTILPLQWQIPFDIFSLQTSVPWNGPTIVLYSVSGLLYLVVFIRKKKWLSSSTIRGCATTAAILISWWLLFDQSHSSAIEVFRLLGFVWFFPVIRFVMIQLGHSRLLYLVVAITVIHAQWGALQFIAQDDLGLYLLGETRLDTTTPGIARFTVSNSHGLPSQKILRAYGPYPHPNSFGGVLVLGYLAGLALLLHKKSRPIGICIGFIFVALLMTFSRSAVLAAALATLVALYSYKTFKVEHKALPGVTPTISTTTKFGSAETPYRRPLIYGLKAMAFWFWGKNVWGILVFIVMTSLVFTPFWIQRLTDPQDVATSERVLGTKFALQLFQSNPWLGVGIGQYTLALQQWLDIHHQLYQPWQVAPVHSVPLLIATQIGIVGSCLVLLGIWQYLRHVHVRRIIWLAPLVPLLLFDHYLLTQVAPLVLVVLWLSVLPHLYPSYPHFPGAKQSVDS